MAPRLPWLVIVWFLGLLIVLFFPVLSLMVREWSSNGDMGHAFFVPVVAGYIVWQDRERIMAQPLWWPCACVPVGSQSPNADRPPSQSCEDCRVPRILETTNTLATDPPPAMPWVEYEHKLQEEWASLLLVLSGVGALLSHRDEHLARADC